MVHCIIQKRYFMYGNLHLHQNLSLKIIFIFIYQILYSSSVNVKDIYFVIGFIFSRSKIRSKNCQNDDSVHVFTSTQYIFYYLSENLLQFIPSMYDKTKIYAIQIKTQLSAYKYMDYSYCQSDSRTGRVRKRKRNRKGTERERENDRYLHIYFKAT